MSDFVTVATFNYVHETMVPKAMLENEGIHAYVKDEISSYIQPFFATSGVGVKLQVAEEDVEDALTVLKTGGYITDEEISE